jgi:hypothetical protein
MRKSYAEVQIERIMGEPHSSEDSRKMVRYLVGVLWLTILISITDTYGVYDVPGEWTATWKMLCGIFIGIMIGLGWAHGWPKQVSEGLQLSPALLHEEE